MQLCTMLRQACCPPAASAGAGAATMRIRALLRLRPQTDDGDPCVAAVDSTTAVLAARSGQGSELSFHF